MHLSRRRGQDRRPRGHPEAPARCRSLHGVRYRDGRFLRPQDERVEAGLPSRYAYIIEAVFRVCLPLDGYLHHHGVMLHGGEPGAHGVMDVGIAINGPLAHDRVVDGTTSFIGYVSEIAILITSSSTPCATVSAV